MDMLIIIIIINKANSEPKISKLTPTGDGVFEFSNGNLFKSSNLSFFSLTILEIEAANANHKFLTYKKNTQEIELTSNFNQTELKTWFLIAISYDLKSSILDRTDRTFSGTKQVTMLKSCIANQKMNYIIYI